LFSSTYRLTSFRDNPSVIIMCLNDENEVVFYNVV